MAKYSERQLESMFDAFVNPEEEMMEINGKYIPVAFLNKMANYDQYIQDYCEWLSQKIINEELFLHSDDSIQDEPEFSNKEKKDELKCYVITANKKITDKQIFTSFEKAKAALDSHLEDIKKLNEEFFDVDEQDEELSDIFDIVEIKPSTK